MGQLLVGKDAEGRPFSIDSSALTKHCIVFGATGSGKTVLCKNIIEEASTSSIPVLAIDPKGDIGCLAIRSREFSFRPYSDVEAKLLGKTPEAYSRELASEYWDKFSQTGRGEDELERFVDRTDVRIYTPRSTNGLPVSMSPRLTPPQGFTKMIVEDPNLALDLLELKASNLLRLAGYTEEDKVQRSLISQILEEEWESGHEPTLENLIELVTSPPFDKLGMLALDDAIGRRERSELSKRLNVLVTDAGSKAWFVGEPPDFEKWFHKTQGRTPVCVMDLRTIPSEEAKHVFVEYLLQELFYWLTRQEGTQTLQYLLYFDEIHGYCPPVREPPSKKILMHLIHVSRAYGLGIVMATQNPVDVDYKVISNANFRFIGNLSTRQDIERVKTGLSLGPEAFQVISGLQTRQFYYQIFDRAQSGIVMPGWLMSYHRGPLEPREVKQLSAGTTPDMVEARVLQMLVPENVLMREVERKRVKRGLLGGSEEKVNFAKTIYLPYLDFRYRYSAEKGFLSKRTVLDEGRSFTLALRELDLGFDPNIAGVPQQLVTVELSSSAVVPGVNSNTLLQDRLDDVRRLMSDHDKQLEALTDRHEVGSRNGETVATLNDHIERLKDARSSRWRIFADGLRLPAKTDPNTVEVREGNLFYMPYFVAKLSRSGESRYLVWDRRGRECDLIADELMRNHRFRELVESRAGS